MYETALALSVACFLGVCFAFARSPYFSIFHPLTYYSAFHGLLFVVRPILSKLLDYQYIYRAYGFTPSPADKITVLLASNLGFLVFAFCCMRQGAVPMAFRQDRIVEAERRQLIQLFPWVLAITVPIGVWSLLQLWQDASQYVSDMNFDGATGVFTNRSGSGYTKEAYMMLASLAAIFAWLMRFRWWSLIPLVTFVLFKAGTGGRGPFITALASVGLFYLYERRRKLPTLTILAGAAAMVASFTVIGEDRGQGVRAYFGEQRDQRYLSTDRLAFMEGMDFGNLEYFEFLVYVIPQRSGTYGYFNDFAQLATEPIPRSLWSGKPVGAPFQRIFFFDYGNPIGMTRSLPGAGWYSLGWLGVALVCGLWGWVLGLIYRRYAQGPQNTLQTVSYMIFLPILIIAFRDGQVVTIFRQGLFFYAPILLWIGFARGLKIPSAAAVRAAFRKRLRATGRAAVPALVAPASAGLPPAVQRRRLALAASASD
jgi:hypothetical protein